MSKSIVEIEETKGNEDPIIEKGAGDNKVVEPTPAEPTKGGAGDDSNMTSLFGKVLDHLLGGAKDSEKVENPVEPNDDDDKGSKGIDKSELIKIATTMTKVAPEFQDFVMAKMNDGVDIAEFLKDNPQYLTETSEGADTLSHELESKVDEKFRDFVKFQIADDAAGLDKFLADNPQYKTKSAPRTNQKNVGGNAGVGHGIELSPQEVRMLRQFNK